MTPELQLAVIQLVARVGISAATTILEGMKNAKTTDDAIAALKAARQLSYDELKQS